ncbi:unnamed protein product [Nesidiocoris tenuis]|uniref:Uncharacterized protein n=1 Tax=Nesidiocoris tenuis TaxID=355587 RepID=A0A6H5H607_9HEMI|nr:unnamed protein product [Nesidiocoris tenuis]
MLALLTRTGKPAIGTTRTLPCMMRGISCSCLGVPRLFTRRLPQELRSEAEDFREDIENSELRRCQFNLSLILKPTPSTFRPGIGGISSPLQRRKQQLYHGDVIEELEPPAEERPSKAVSARTAPLLLRIERSTSSSSTSTLFFLLCLCFLVPPVLLRSLRWIQEE